MFDGLKFLTQIHLSMFLSRGTGLYLFWGGCVGAAVIQGSGAEIFTQSQAHNDVSWGVG